jgi:error-prone DNA polymerase
MIGLDTAKASFQVHGVNEEGHAELKRKLRRSEVIAFFEAQPACTVVLEACGAAHHWGRVLSGLGHTLKLVAPEAVRPFVKRGRKNDAADAAALCEAARRPEVKFVPVKSQEQQATLALHTARALLVKQQIMLANAMRSLGAEFGLVVPQGLGRLGELVALMEVDAGVPETAGQAFRRCISSSKRRVRSLQGSRRHSSRTPGRMRRPAGWLPFPAWARSPPR